jgi:hypothetical protein
VAGIYGHSLCDLGKLERAEFTFKELARSYPAESAGPSGFARMALLRVDWPTTIKLLLGCTSRFPQQEDMKWWLPMLKNCQTS